MDRLFLGIALTDAARDGLLRALPFALVPDRAAHPDDWHITLRFLGDVTDEVSAHLRTMLRRSRLGVPFDLTLGGLRMFEPSSGSVVLWAGVKNGSEVLASLERGIDKVIVQSGFPSRKNAFRPHVTLSRTTDRKDACRFMAKVPSFSVPMVVSDIVLFRSRPAGALRRYEVVERFAL